MAIAEPSKESKVTFSRKVKSLLGYDLHTWEQLMLGSLIVAGLSAVAVAFSTIVVVKLQRDENADASSEFERYKLETGETIARANERAAEANQKAQEASLELARLTTPRELTQEQRSRIVGKIKQFAGTEYDITIGVADPEILGFVSIVEEILATAGWSELDWKADPERYVDGYIRGGDEGGKAIIREGVAVTDVEIAVLLDQPTKLNIIAKALSDALAAEGVASTTKEYGRHRMSSTNLNAVHVFIGRKT